MNNYIKDSGNNYTLYIDQGTDYQFDVISASFSLQLTTDAEFFGTIKEHSSSKKCADLIITKSGDGTKITVSISADVSYNLKSNRYLFEIAYRLDSKITKAVSGSIIVHHTLLSI